MRKPLIALGLAMSASLGAIPAASTFAAAPASNPPTNPYRPTNSLNAVSGAAIVQTALQYIGYPYTATGDSPSTGFSCIGLVSFVYRQNGIKLPGDLGGALAYAAQVPFSDLQPGDILYFQNTIWAGISHAAIYIGGGKFVHAEWYGYGVRISSFINDPRDGNYWIGKYLGANRPWQGAAVSAPITSPVPAGISPRGVAAVAPGAQVQKTIVGGTPATVTAPSLNVRSGPSKHHNVQQILPNGASVTVIGRHGHWYKVQLADGTIGWVVDYGIGLGTAPGSTTVSGTGALPTVGNPTAPVRTGAVQPSQARTLTAKTRVSALRVHSSPSIAAPVTDTAYRGQRLVVLARRNGWLEVRMPDGTVGWVYSGYMSVKHARSHAARPYTAYSRGAPRIAYTGTQAHVAMNVRTGPSLRYSIATVLPAGSRYRVLGWASGWAHVQLASGLTGWISGGLVRRPPSPPSRSYAPRSTRTTVAHYSSGRSVITAGVRVHSAPGVRAPVVTLAAAGTHVRVLGYRGGWTLVRLPNGTTGYVLGVYVR